MNKAAAKPDAGPNIDNVTRMSSAGRESLKTVFVGHVDHGKSTMIGRLLHDTGNLPPEKLAMVEASSSRRGMKLEWAFALDALQAERDQAITIDTTQVWFRWKQRTCCIIDAPGHREFLKNMVTGASSADAAFVLVDAAEGIQEQSHRHAYLLHLLGIRQVAVLVNKMDLVGYDEGRYRDIVRDYRAYRDRLGLHTGTFIPTCAPEGEGIAGRGDRMPWYDGPLVVDALEAFTPRADADTGPLRYPIQGVYKFDERRLLAGRVASGTIRRGDKVLNGM